MYAFVLLALAGLVACQRAPVASFTPVEVVSQATANGATPMFLVTSAGHRVLSWVAAPDGGTDGRLQVAVTPADGGAAYRSEIADPLGGIAPHGEAPPQLATDGRNGVFALYAVSKQIDGARFPVSSLRFVRSEDAGRSWSAPVTVNELGRHGDFGSHNFHALGTAPDGTLWVTWLGNDRGRSTVRVTRSADGGRTWAPAQLLVSDEACPCCRTAVTADAKGRLYVAWRGVREGNVRDIVVSTSSDGGASWSSPIRPRDEGWVFDGCPHAGPSLKIDAAGRAHLAWWTGKPGEAGVWYAVSDDGGTTWTSQPIATGERAMPAHVQLALGRDGRVVVAWDDGLSKTPRILLRRSTDHGATFGAEEQVSGEGAAQYPVLAVVGDSVLVAWKQQTAEALRQEMAARADMKNPKAVMGLPRVGQAEVFLRRAKL